MDLKLQPLQRPPNEGDGQRIGNGSTPTMEEARNALQRAMIQLVERNGENYVAKAGLKSLIKRLMPSFDERALGCDNFSASITRCSDLVEVVDGLSGGHVALANYQAPPDLTEPLAATTTVESDDEPAPGIEWNVPPGWPAPQNVPDDHSTVTG